MRLGTFNLMHGRSLDDGLVDAGRVREAIAGLDADVLGLQEVDRGQLRSGHADLARIAAEATGGTAGAADMLFVPAVVGTPGEAFRVATDADQDGVDPHYGVALISRFPVLEWRGTKPAPPPLRAPGLLPGPQIPKILLHGEPPGPVAPVGGGPRRHAATHTPHPSLAY